MGIESFFGGYIAKNYKKCIEGKLPDKVSSLFVDCNGIFHHCAQKVYGYGDFEGAGITPQDTNTLIKEIQNKREDSSKPGNGVNHDLEIFLFFFTFFPPRARN